MTKSVTIIPDKDDALARYTIEGLTQKMLPLNTNLTTERAAAAQRTYEEFISSALRGVTKKSLSAETQRALKNKIRNTGAYKAWKYAVLERAGYTCQKCYQGGDLDAHHIRSLSELLEEHSILTVKAALECNPLWDVTNGRSLCRNCHQKTHRMPRAAQEID